MNSRPISNIVKTYKGTRVSNNHVLDSVNSFSCYSDRVINNSFGGGLLTRTQSPSQSRLGQTSLNPLEDRIAGLGGGAMIGVMLKHGYGQRIEEIKTMVFLQTKERSVRIGKCINKMLTCTNSWRYKLPSINMSSGKGLYGTESESSGGSLSLPLVPTTRGTSPPSKRDERPKSMK